MTCNPTRREDFRNVYVNCTAGSPERVVDGTVLPHQYLYNTVEGGGRTVDVGSSGEDLPSDTARNWVNWPWWDACCSPTSARATPTAPWTSSGS